MQKIKPKGLWPALAVMALFSAACGSSQAKQATVTFTESGCTYDGPKTMPAASFAFKWIVEDTSHDSFGAVLVQLEDGKTAQDLVAEPVDSGATWIRALSPVSVDQPGPVTEMVDVDLRPNAKFKPGAVYIACVYGDRNGEQIKGAIGPIQVSP